MGNIVCTLIAAGQEDQFLHVLGIQSTEDVVCEGGIALCNIDFMEVEEDRQGVGADTAYTLGDRQLGYITAIWEGKITDGGELLTECNVLNEIDPGMPGGGVLVCVVVVVHVAAALNGQDACAQLQGPGQFLATGAGQRCVGNLPEAQSALCCKYLCGRACIAIDHSHLGEREGVAESVVIDGDFRIQNGELLQIVTVAEGHGTNGLHTCREDQGDQVVVVREGIIVNGL